MIRARDFFAGGGLAALVFCFGFSLVCGYGGSASASSDGLAANAEVLETMDSRGYTYVRVKTDNQGEIWAAGPRTPIKIDDRVNIPAGSLMSGFESKSLGRTFDSIYFVGSLEVLGASGATAAGSGHGRAKVESVSGVDTIQRADGGFTIAELFAKMDELSGKQVTVNGKVVKFSGGIMGRNWIHIQDGTGKAGTNDLTLTTQDTVRVGDIVVVEGTAITDKDFGAGYRYDLILEKASVVPLDSM